MNHRGFNFKLNLTSITIKIVQKKLFKGQNHIQLVETVKVTTLYN